MPIAEIEKIAEDANFIVSGYAFTKRDDGFISILNLEHPDCAMVVNKQGGLRTKYKNIWGSSPSGIFDSSS